MMVTGFMPVRAQFLYRDSHIFAGQLPSNYTTVASSSSPGIYIGPDYSIEYWDGGLNFWRPANSSNPGNYKLFIGDNGNMGVGRKPTTYKLEVNGQVWTTAGLLITSDATQKRNVRDMGESRSEYVTKLKQLKGKSYEKLIESGRDNAAEVERMVASGKIPMEKAQEVLAELNARKKDTYKSEYGFIAQDIKELFPVLVEENAEGILAVNYTGLIPVLLEAIKDLQDKVEQLENRKGNDGGISIRSAPYPAYEDVVEAGSDEYLSQNVPNPIDGSTVIRYSLPEGATQASIAIYSIGGSAVKIIPVDAYAKSGSITLYASDLAKGINVYKLTANGIVLGSRKMINP
ncbi:MAG: tail fiber domain-containing protein [Tannerella sp.]|nr:tail fiber domain-containing protein [Tannerella sp.]